MTLQCYPNAMEIQFTARIFKEGRTFVAHALELDVPPAEAAKRRLFGT